MARMCALPFHYGAVKINPIVKDRRNCQNIRPRIPVERKPSAEVREIIIVVKSIPSIRDATHHRRSFLRRLTNSDYINVSETVMQMLRNTLT